MVVMTMLNSGTTNPRPAAPSGASVLAALQAAYPQLTFVDATLFSWNSAEQRVLYRQSRLDKADGVWALLHEVGHATLAHNDFRSDFELLQMEAAAWEQAEELARRFGLTIDSAYVQDCLDSYRDWLHMRSTCPACYERCLQSNAHTYSCHNCNTKWAVSRSRHCRPYRKRGPSFAAL